MFSQPVQTHAATVTRTMLLCVIVYQWRTAVRSRPCRGRAESTLMHSKVLLWHETLRHQLSSVLFPGCSRFDTQQAACPPTIKRNQTQSTKTPKSHGKKDSRYQDDCHRTISPTVSWQKKTSTTNVQVLGDRQSNRDQKRQVTWFTYSNKTIVIGHVICVNCRERRLISICLCFRLCQQ